MASIESSAISKATIIRGHVRGEGSVRIDGEVRGNVEVTGDVELGPGAAVTGNVSGARLTIAGTVDGDLTGSEAIVLDTTANVTGDLRAARIGIAEGAHFRGSVQMDAAAPRASLSSASRPRPRPEPMRVMPKIASAPSKPEPGEVQAKKELKKPPPPVVHAPSRTARGRKKSR
jgi:cytoskeletal protein CcmA (bactofilin family)